MSACTLQRPPRPEITITGQTICSDYGTDNLFAVRVEVKAGKGTFRTAKGIASWNHRAKLRPGRNVVLVRSVNIAETTSKLVRMQILRD